MYICDYSDGSDVERDQLICLVSNLDGTGEQKQKQCEHHSASKTFTIHFSEINIAEKVLQIEITTIDPMNYPNRFDPDTSIVFKGNGFEWNPLNNV